MKHEYRMTDGTLVPGVTTVISTSLGWGQGALMWWAWSQGKEGKNFRDSADKAAEAGTIAHKMAENDIKGIPQATFPAPDATIAEQATAAYQGYLDWKRMTRLELVGSEISLVSDMYAFGGTLDGIGLIDGKHALIDFKTSNGTYASHIIQLAAYKNLWEAKNGRLLDGGIHLLRFGKDGGDFHHSHYPRERMDKPWQAFLLLRALYDLKKPVEKMV